jgi:hypothetical protein
MLFSNMEKASVRYVPSTFQKLQITVSYRKRIPGSKISKTVKRHARGLTPQLTREPYVGAKANDIPFHESSFGKNPKWSFQMLLGCFSRCHDESQRCKKERLPWSPFFG